LWLQAVHLLHAFSTGFLCHALAVAPLYLWLQLTSPSVLLLPLTVSLDVLLILWFWRGGEFNDWL
jgi:hypothetical protein